MKREADFPKPIKRLLAENAGYKCSAPSCGITTVGPGATPTQSAKTGTACHIYSAADNGPRGTGGLSAEDRQKEENGIWCCKYHGGLIDTNQGGRFPAELLKYWKRLHGARMLRETAGIRTNLGWVDQLEIINSFWFKPSTKLHFSKATLIYGNGPSGKSCVCQLLAGIWHSHALDRWRNRNHDIRLNYFAPEAQTILLTIKERELHRSDGVRRLPQGPSNFRLVYLDEKFEREIHRDSETDELSRISTVLGADPETVKSLCDDIRLNGHPLWRLLEFREEHIEPNENEGEPGREGWFLYVPVGKNPSYMLPFTNLATSEQIGVMIQFAAALARVQSHDAPTLLVLDGGGWNWGDSLLDVFAPYLAKQPFQVVLVLRSRPMNFGGEPWQEWGAAYFECGKGVGNNTVTEASR
jgi:hypothetical protein